MSLFGSILEKLGLKKKAPPPAMTQAAPPPAATPPAAAAPTPPPPPPPPVPMAEVDVISMLEGWAAQTPQKLNWRTSIVDLMKLLGMESSLAERKELATELGCPAEYMHDSAKMNVWLHKEVLRQIAKNGGNVPAELYD
jgi:3-oxoacyl-ACP reductase-like protein